MVFEVSRGERDIFHPSRTYWDMVFDANQTP